jgi:hypothetical protein
MSRGRIPQGIAERSLLRCPDPVFEIAAAPILAIGEIRKQYRAVGQRKVDLLAFKENGKKTDPVFAIRQWNHQLFGEPAADSRVYLLEAVRGSYQKYVAIMGLDAVHLLEQLAHDLIGQRVTPSSE